VFDTITKLWSLVLCSGLGVLGLLWLGTRKGKDQL